MNADLETIASCGGYAQVASVTVFAFPPGHPAREKYNDLYVYDVTVERTAPDTWAVRRGQSCWDGNGWVSEPIPSSRSKDFLRAHRWPLAEAIGHALHAAAQQRQAGEKRIAEIERARAAVPYTEADE